MTKPLTKSREIRLLLDNIRSVHNVGSIFRTAEAGGVSMIYCLGTTPLPVDRFNNPRKDLVKVALGAEKLIPWQSVKNGKKLIESLKKEGFKILALEQAPGSIDYRNVKKFNKVLIILGNEVVGVSKKLLDLADIVAEIPMKGQKESLNVSVAVGIMIFAID